MRGPYGPFPNTNKRLTGEYVAPVPPTPPAVPADETLEQRWQRERDTPGAFEAAIAANRLKVLDAVPTCDGCGGRGFCQCDPLTARVLRQAQPQDE